MKVCLVFFQHSAKKLFAEYFLVAIRQIVAYECFFHLTCHRSKPLKRCSSIGGGGGHAGGAVAAAGVFYFYFSKILCQVSVQHSAKVFPECLIKNTRQKQLCQVCFHQVVFAECNAQQIFCRLFSHFAECFWHWASLLFSVVLEYSKQSTEDQIRSNLSTEPML